MIYLDHAATTLPKPPEVIQAVANAMTHVGSLGRSGHHAAAAASQLAFECRSVAGEMFGADPENVVFTFNTTHGLNLAINTLVSTGDHVVISGFEHNAVLRPLYAREANITIAGRRLFDPEDTILAFKDAITPETKAVICTAVSNVFGYVLPIMEIAVLCRQRNVPLVIDAAQCAGIFPISLKETGAAFIAIPGHKGLLGPQGTGLLLCGQLPETLLQGGTGSLSRSPEMPEFLPDRAEAGTQNIHGIAGLLEGMKYIKKRGLSSICEHEALLLSTAVDRLSENKELTLFTGASGTQAGVLSMCHQALSGEEVAVRLADAGFAVRAGLHCAPLAHESAGTLETGTVRMSFSALSSIADVSDFCAFMAQMKKS